jgi:chromosome segregation ATPase
MTGRLSAELDSIEDKLDTSTAKGEKPSDEVKELKSQLSQSQKEHNATIKARIELETQLELLKGEYATKAQEYESTIKTANDEFAAKEKQLRLEMASTKNAADALSKELESTKVKLDKATERCINTLLDLIKTKVIASSFLS